MSVTAGVSGAAIAVREKLRVGRQTKVRRYWPGKAPEWAEEAEENDDVRMQKVSVLDRAFPKNDDLGLLGRMIQGCVVLLISELKTMTKLELIIFRRRRIEESRDEEDDDDALEERRRRIREKNLKRAQEEASLIPVEEEGELQEEEKEELQEEEEEESKYETDSRGGCSTSFVHVMQVKNFGRSGRSKWTHLVHVMQVKNFGCSTSFVHVVQVKNFGRSGRSKWTHLVNEDTTDWRSRKCPAFSVSIIAFG